MVSGNKGEWSEFYVLLKLLSDGRLYAADKNKQRNRDLFFPVLSVTRDEKEGKHVIYDVFDEFHSHIIIYLNEDIIGTVDVEDLAEDAKMLFEKIIQGGDRSFAIPAMEEVMKKMLCEKIAAPSTDKTDINVEIHDTLTGYTRQSGFSIKSEVGSPPTLLNASRATNFVFDVDGIPDELMAEINSIEDGNKIIKRIKRITDKGKLSYRCAANKVFEGNLMLIDTYMDRIIGEALLIYYQGGYGDCKDVVDELEKRNPLAVGRRGFYEYKFKKFLSSIALGMVPSTEWDGKDEANGGYIIVTKTGDVLAYHIYNRDYFEEYLLENTRFERGSTSRHDFASIYKNEDGDMSINMNLQIRFK